MLTVTESAVSNFKEYLNQNNLTDSSIRVMLQSSCAGPGLGLGLDEKTADDQLFEQDGLTFLVADGIFAATGAITVDFVKESSGCGCSGGGGFSVTSEKPLVGGGCADSCSSGSCGC
ncbi:MAG TPA: adhesin [Desulfurivibrio alkaliphilus]|uniref:Adhesin n=1 Tax=Desulfurivibrio alkaliphilus TaxID=427923 RepID=A0A7C2TJT4_9BACT|nr:adhesin [Desulfurivibrio alkaliphilus]